MEYEDPPEWRDRHVASREGWPTHGGGGSPGAPRGHRYREPDRAGQYFPDDMPTDPISEDQVTRSQYGAGRAPVAASPPPTRRLDGWRPPEVPVIHLFDREPEGLRRAALWVGIVRDFALTAAALGALWVVGVFVSYGGVPLWIPR